MWVFSSRKYGDMVQTIQFFFVFFGGHGFNREKQKGFVRLRQSRFQTKTKLIILGIGCVVQ